MQDIKSNSNSIPIRLKYVLRNCVILSKTSKVTWESFFFRDIIDIVLDKKSTVITITVRGVSVRPIQFWPEQKFSSCTISNTAGVLLTILSNV